MPVVDTQSRIDAVVREYAFLDITSAPERMNPRGFHSGRMCSFVISRST
jgi:hypothetical protein